MRLFHFLDREFGLKVLRERQLKISRLDRLNDPFELLAVASHDPNVRQAFRETRDQIAKDTGIICFSRDWHNPVQWSHYAEKHHGLCLGFDVPDKDVKLVSYSRRRPIDDGSFIAGGLAAEEFMERALATKFSHWRYENEARVFVRIDRKNRIDPIWYYPFDNKIKLREVVVGHLSDLTHSEMEEMIDPRDRGNVSIIKARLAFRTFRVVQQRSRKLWPSAPV